jgi:threonine dehydrogenase-like Zn-dependent dehydrogenase
MHRVSYLGRGRMVVEEVEPPTAPAGCVRVAVDSVGICKSDIYGYGQVNDRRDTVLASGQTLVMGHEPCGIVDQLGPGATGPAIGTPVAVNPVVGCGACDRCAAGWENLCERRVVIGCAPAAPGGFADAMVVPARQVVELTGEIALELGSLAEPLTVGAHGVALASPARADDVLVIGGGIIGIGAALAARRRSDGDVVVLEPLAERRELCERLGLTAAHPDEVFAGDRQFDVALDCVARPETLSGAIDAVPPRGAVVLVGIWEDRIPLPVSAVVSRETRILGSYGYTRSEFADVVGWLCRREVDVSILIEHRIGFDGVIAAFDGYMDGSLTAVRTVVQPARRRAGDPGPTRRDRG